MYVAKVVKNVKIAESPLWLQNRLMASGIRPHNNVVDITNYVLMEYGQPLHAFDYDRLGTGEIAVRLAEEGEKITTLDDAERTLKAHQLVITNGKEPVAIAGVMGGANSEVHDGTTTVVIESAYFAPASIRTYVERTWTYVVMQVLDLKKVLIQNVSLQRQNVQHNLSRNLRVEKYWQGPSLLMNSIKRLSVLRFHRIILTTDLE